MYEGFGDEQNNSRIAWPDFCRSGALTSGPCPLLKNCNCIRCPITDCFYSGLEQVTWDISGQINAFSPGERHEVKVTAQRQQPDATDIRKC